MLQRSLNFSGFVETCIFILKTFIIAREFRMLNMFRPYRVLFICITHYSLLICISGFIEGVFDDCIF